MNVRIIMFIFVNTIFDTLPRDTNNTCFSIKDY